MFTSRSYYFLNEIVLKKREKLYDSKKCRFGITEYNSINSLYSTYWINFIVITMLIGLMPLPLMANVAFTGTTYFSNTTTLIADATTLPPTLKTTSLQFDGDKIQNSAELNIASNDKSVPKILEQSIIIGSTLKCEADYNNPCKISCSGSVSNVKKTLETQQRKCLGGTLEVILHYCKFSSKTMTTDFLKGNFYLQSLTIRNCDLNYIRQGAFNQYSVSNTLKTLIFENTQFDTLDATKFVGLQVVNYFRLENKEPDMFEFIGVSFLQPMAATLNETKLLQYTTKGTKYNPLSWFTGANFVQLLSVNLSNNYFPDTLGNKTFLTLTNVQELILANCQIYTMQSGTFDTISKTLQYLDLSNNQLKTLSADFLSNLGNNLRLELSANSWNCTCENNDLIKFIQASEIDLVEEPRCTSPEDLEGINLKYVLLQCGDIIPNTTPATKTTTPATTTTTPATTTTTPATTTLQDTTEYTAPNEPQDSSTSSKAPATTTPSINDTTTENTVSDISDNPDPNDTTITTSTKTTITTAVDPSISSPTGTTETTAIDPTSNRTEALPTTTTEVPPINPVDIGCKDYGKPTVFNLTIRNYDALLGIYSESSTSVVLLILNNITEMSLIYFIPKLYYSSEYLESGINSSAKGSSSLCENGVTSTIIHIEGLVQNEAYVFCLVPHDEFRISPFNCRSHQLGDSTDPMESWLRINDIAWLVPVVGFGIFVCVILGSCLVYWLLRWSPTLLYGSKRLIKMGCKPQLMLLLPKVDHVSARIQYLSALAKMRPSFSDELQPERYYDYMQYYKKYLVDRAQSESDVIKS